MSKKKKSKKAAKRAPEARKEGPSRSEVSQAAGINRLGVSVAVVLLVGLAVAVAILGKRPPAPAGDGAAEGVRNGEPDDGSSKKRDIPISATDYARGPVDAPVTVVEFSDFQCPFCKKARATLSELVKLYPDQVRLVFKNFPLDSSCNPYIRGQLHPLGCRAARMARCAGRQGRFWEVHDAIFELPELSPDALDGLAASLGLDESELASCMADEEPASRIRADIDEGRKLGVMGTPTLYVNGRETPNFSIGNLKFIVEKAVSANGVKSP